MKISEDFEQQLKYEYEVLGSSIEDLERTHKINLSDLNTSGWSHKPVVPEIVDIVEEEPVVDVEPLDTIEDFKQKALEKAKNLLRGVATPKDLKELVTVVDTIERSYKKSEDSPTINVLINNLQQFLKETPDDV